MIPYTEHQKGESTMTDAQRKLLAAQLEELDRIHEEMYDMMGLREISDPRVTLIYRMAAVMDPLRALAAGGEGSKEGRS